MRNLDFSSWHSLLVTLIGLALLTLIGVGVRLLLMLSIQQRRERLNRQINERLRALIAAYKVLGGSFTGDLAVDPRHLRESRQPPDAGKAAPGTLDATVADGSDRRRRIRDSVEAALSDIILLGTEEQVRLALRAANDLVAGHPVHTHELVVSLRNFIRKALDIDPIPADLAIPAQGPARPSASGGRGKGERDGDDGKQGGGMKDGNMLGGAGGGSGAGVQPGSVFGTDEAESSEHHG
ncbi:hypothetical protein CWB41_06540 [Methylovirgula ligni]|uniref:Uncharacterized protein n=1 Tax=Methylovirgula ligni TaxID=569860 RepID=A0A3D9Z2D1_9HYPH|nr:hypothetical protein [Methylovirgula ligni]QAY95433.1 hypothetical protein CWB41_06540 [Methylovirgula ligni]REF89241.1 hypothetical protein DES32_0460 [Methylovirgula ligni]